MTRGVGGRSPTNITKHLRGVDFPANLQDLIQKARDNNADDEVIQVLEQMPDQEFQSMADVMAGFGQSGEEQD